MTDPLTREELRDAIADFVKPFIFGCEGEELTAEAHDECLACAGALLEQFTIGLREAVPKCYSVPSFISASGASCTYPRQHAGPHSWEVR